MGKLLRKFFNRGVVLLLIFNSWFLSLIIPASVLADTPASNIIISEIKLGGPGLAEEPREFVSLFNQSPREIELTGWRLEYAKEGFGSENCESTDWSFSEEASTIELAGTLPTQTIVSFEFGLTDSKDGALRIIEQSADQTIVHDLVGWGEQAPCTEDQATTRPSTTSSPAKSLQRYLDCRASLPVDTNNNRSDFFVSDTPAYGQLGGFPLPDCDTTSQPSVCEGVIISEILPNPSGTDSGSEFIELHNPTANPVFLAGCRLQTSASSSVFNFADATGLEAGEYRAFYDDQTKLTLPNSAGGAIYLLTADNLELEVITYPARMKDDVSWAKFSSGWQATYTPTPNQANKLTVIMSCPAGQKHNPETNRCRNVSGTQSELKACRSDQQRNSATNRCRLVASVASQLKPCGPGQERNPATNRCRSLASASSLRPCNPNQQRNPETNRCRKIDSAGTLKPCAEGQQRNPATNRCRRVASASSDSVLGTPAAIPNSPLTTGLVATTAGLALVYGAYEFRGDIRNKFELFKRYLSNRTNSGS